MILEDNLFTKNHCSKDSDQQNQIPIKIIEDVENKGFYQPTTSYINKLLAEHSPDGTIDMNLIQKLYNTNTLTPKNNLSNSFGDNNQLKSTTGLKGTYRRAQSANRSIRSPDNNQFINRFNQRFYYDQLNKMKTKQKYIQDVQILKELEEEMETFPFKPQVNTVSKFLAKERKPENANVEDYLLQRGKDIKEKKLNTEIAEKWQRDNEFDFKPKVNRQSEEIVMRRSLGNQRIFNNKCDELYDLAITKKQQACNKTQINPSMHIKASEQSNYLLYKSNVPLDFLERQNYLEQKLKDNKAQLEQIHKPTFQPQLVSKPINPDVT